MSKRSISGLRIEDLIEGTGPAAEKGNTVTVQAIGRMNKGDIFLSTYDFGQPWTFEAGGRKALAGLAKGVIGMKVGGKRRIRISPHLGYRDMTMPANELYKIAVPPQSVLIFDIDLLLVRRSQAI
jgi:peptidylprolyl isomerase